MMIENTNPEWLKTNIDTEELPKSLKSKNSEENLVKDLKESLRETVDESINMLNSLMKEIQEKVKDDSVKEETQNLVSLLSKNILNLTEKDVDEFSFINNYEKTNLEEE